LKLFSLLSSSWSSGAALISFYVSLRAAGVIARRASSDQASVSTVAIKFSYASV
jgi:hypothetical protein